MKTISILLFIGLAGLSSQESGIEKLDCTLKTCGINLLSFHDLSLPGLLNKFHVASFCIRECAPPAIHELFQSLMFVITKRIPGVCGGDACAGKNRFIALGQCLKHKVWQTVQCGTKLLDIAQLPSEHIPSHVYKNKTCTILIDSIQCVENLVHQCGQTHQNLFNDLFGDIIEMGIGIYCRRSYKYNKEITDPESDWTTPSSNVTAVIKIHKPVAKGYKSRKDPNKASGVSFSIYTLVLSVAFLTFINKMR